MIAALWLACVPHPVADDVPCALANPPPVRDDTHSDRFRIPAAPVNLLWLVDDGPNGADAQAAVVDGLPAFLSAAPESGWRVAVLPASEPVLQQAGGRAFAEAEGAEPLLGLTALVEVGTVGAGPSAALATLGTRRGCDPGPPGFACTQPRA